VEDLITVELSPCADDLNMAPGLSPQRSANQSFSTPLGGGVIAVTCGAHHWSKVALWFAH
jgi:hypothetical protein